MFQILRDLANENLKTVCLSNFEFFLQPDAERRYCELLGELNSANNKFDCFVLDCRLVSPIKLTKLAELSHAKEDIGKLALQES